MNISEYFYLRRIHTGETHC